MLLGVLQLALERGIVLAHLLVHAQLFELHVQLEHFFEKIRWHNLFLGRSGLARLVGRGLGLLFQLHALQAEQIFGARNRVLQRAIGVVELRSFLQAPLLLVMVGAGR